MILNEIQEIPLEECEVSGDDEDSYDENPFIDQVIEDDDE